MMTSAAHTISKIILRSLAQNVVLAGLSGGLILVLVYIILMRPFTAGFDLVRLRESGGRPAVQLVNEQGQSIQNEITKVRALILDGTYRDGIASIEAIEQLVGTDHPQIFGVEIRGTNQDTLLIGQAGRDKDNQTYVIDQGFSASFDGERLETQQLRFNPDSGAFQTSGPTTLTQDEGQIQTNSGVRLTRDGDLEIGGP